MYVCIYIYTYIHIYIDTYKYIYIYIDTYIYIYPPTTAISKGERAREED